MSHEFESGFSGNNKAAWHGLAKVVPGTLGLEEAWRTAGLDWEVQTVPVICADTNAPVPGCKAIRRTSDMQVFGAVGEGYEPIQNKQLFQVAEALLQQGAQFETAGSLFGGRLVWVLVRTDGFVDAVTGDKVDPFIMVSSGHDGKHKLRGDLEAVRTICWNTFRQAIAASKRTFAISHRSGWVEHVAEAKRMLGLAKDHFGQLTEDLSRLATVELTLKRQVAIVDRMIPLPADALKQSAKDHVYEQRLTLDQLLAKPTGRQFGEGTLYQAWNGLSEFASHALELRRQVGTDTQRAERRMVDLSFDTGKRAEFAERGWAVVQELARA